MNESIKLISVLINLKCKIQIFQLLKFCCDLKFFTKQNRTEIYLSSMFDMIKDIYF